MDRLVLINQYGEVKYKFCTKREYADYLRKKCVIDSYALVGDTYEERFEDGVEAIAMGIFGIDYEEINNAMIDSVTEGISF